MKNYLIPAVISIVVVAIGLMFFSPTPNVINQMVGSGGNSLTTPDFTYGGITSYRVALNLADIQANTGTGTSTVCAIQSPAATSTLRMAAVRFDLATTTAVQVTLAKASTPYATTTALGGGALGASAQGTFIATTTPLDSVDEDKVFGPSKYFVVGVSGGAGGKYTPTGVCQAEFDVI